MNLIDKIYQGMVVAWAKRKENQPPPGYRGGNTGILLDGTSAGQCVRRALARYLGYDTETDWDTQLMFDVGELNEDRWDNYLRLAGLDIRRTDGFTSWTTDAGTQVTGSPDSLIYENDKPIHGIEHKHASSMNTALAAISGNPKLEHLAQAGHYSMALGYLPYSLIYTSSTMVEGAEWKMKSAKVPRPGEPRSEFCNYTYYRYTGQTRTYKTGKKAGQTIKLKQKIDTNPAQDDDLLPSEIMRKYSADFADLKSIRPFAIQFPLEWRGGVLFFHDGEDWQETPISDQNIRDYFNEIDRIQERKRLGPRPYNLTWDGESMPWSPCNYCTLKDICDTVEDDYDQWVTEVKKL